MSIVLYLLFMLPTDNCKNLISVFTEISKVHVPNVEITRSSNLKFTEVESDAPLAYF